VFGSAGLSFLRSNFGTESLDAAATIQMGRLPRDMRQVVDPTYAALLKIALIEDTVPFAQFQRRVEEFWEFLEGTLRAVLSVELVTALLFFSGQIGGFIPLRASSPLAQRFADVRSSAWDIYLARMASTFISQGDESELTLPLIITGDERLKKIVRGQRLFGVISMDKQAPFPVLLTDFEYLESFVPKSWDSEWLRRRIEQRKVPAQRDEVDIQRIIADLEDQVRRRFGE